MAYCRTPPRGSAGGGFTPENKSPWMTSLSPVPKTPNSKKPNKINEDIVYMSKKDLEKELKAFVNMFVLRKVLKESEVASYHEYLKKAIKNLVVDFSQLDKMEDFSSATRSPGHRKAESVGLSTEHLLKLRNFQLERDRLAYEEKIQTHGKHILDLEEQIGRLISEYRSAADASVNHGSRAEDLQKNLENAEQLNMSLSKNNEQILLKNAGLKREIENLQDRISELEEVASRESQRRQIEKEALDAMEILKKENERLNGKLTEREIAAEQLESEKARLLKEIGGRIENIKEFEEKVVEEESRRLTLENSFFTNDVREKDSVIMTLKMENERLLHETRELHNYISQIAEPKHNRPMQILETSEIKLLDAYKENKEHSVHSQKDANTPSTKQFSVKTQAPYLNFSQSILENRINKCASDGMLLDYNSTTPLHNLEERARKVSRNLEEDLASFNDNSYHSLSYYDMLRKQIEKYRTSNILLQKKVENYYMQIEELNDTLKLTNENLDLAQNRCITLQRELENKANLENLVQTLLTLINKLENKIECLVEENLSLQKANQENSVVITKLKNQLEEDIQTFPKGFSREDSGVETAEGSTLMSRMKESTALELEFIKKGYEAELRRLVEMKDKEIEEERIIQKNNMDKYNAHLDVFGKKVQSLVTVNEDLGRELENIKTDFANYKIVVISILEEASRSIENLKKYDHDIQNLQSVLMEMLGDDNTEIVRLREVYSMMKRDVADAEKLLDERRLLA